MAEEQSDANLENVLLKDYLPKSELVVPEHRVERASHPVIDAHCHMGRILRDADEAPKNVKALVKVMDECGVRAILNLDGGSGRGLPFEDTVRLLKEPYPDRFILFHRLNWKRLEEGEGFGEKMAEDLREAVSKGAQGVKISKAFGLRHRDQQGELVMPGDARMDPVFETAAELGIPILFHIADPVAFFKPLTAENERLEEMANHPGWHFYKDEFPPFEVLMETQVKFVQRYPKTTFISAHVCSYAENLQAVGEMFDACPNLYGDLSARFAELGRQPRASYSFFTKYADRLLFGTDGPASAEEYRICFRFMETEDEYFDYSTHSSPGQGRWRIYGVALPDDVLAKVYYKNAAGIIPGVE